MAVVATVNLSRPFAARPRCSSDGPPRVRAGGRSLGQGPCIVDHPSLPKRGTGNAGSTRLSTGVAGPGSVGGEGPAMRLPRVRLMMWWLLAAVATVAILLAAVREVLRRPEAIVVGGPVHNFGAMPPYAAGQRRWVIRNSGRAPLRLDVAGSSAHCVFTSPKRFETMTIAPGGQSVVTVIWETRRPHARYSQGATPVYQRPGAPEDSILDEGVRPADRRAEPISAARPRLNHGVIGPRSVPERARLFAQCRALA
jgi:hypothetical protein